MVAFSCLGPFPEDILREEILLKLPAKSLLRFKSVSKGWRSIISTPAFVTKHFNRDIDLNQGLVIYCTGFDDDVNMDFNSCSYFPDADATLSRHDVPNQLLLQGKITFFRGPCNGIYCIHSGNNRFALWNPTTRRLRPIYCSPSFIFDEMGFGVDPLTGDFKIVLIKCADMLSSSFAVYTSRNHSWKYLEQESLCDVESDVPTDKSYSNTFVNGYYYWLKHQSCKGSFSILAFDMHNELFEEIKVPDDIQLLLGPRPKLHRLNDSLAFVSKDSGADSTYVDIWLMEGKGQWIFFISLFLPLRVSQVYGFWGGKRILLDVYQEDSVHELITFDFTSLNRPFAKVLEIKNFLTAAISDLIPMHYKESLFAVDGEDEIEDYDPQSPEGLKLLGYQGPFTKIDLLQFLKNVYTDSIIDLIRMHYKGSLFAVNDEDGIEDYDPRCPEGLKVLGYQGPFTQIGCVAFRMRAMGYLFAEPSFYSDEEVEIPRDIGNQYLVAESDNPNG